MHQCAYNYSSVRVRTPILLLHSNIYLNLDLFLMNNQENILHLRCGSIFYRIIIVNWYYWIRYGIFFKMCTIIKFYDAKSEIY